MIYNDDVLLNLFSGEDSEIENILWCLQEKKRVSTEVATLLSNSKLW